MLGNKAENNKVYFSLIAVSKAKFMVGYTTGEFGSQDPLTKEQSSKLIYLLMKNLKKI
jgi:hypothetical protein